jgi:hypothetical protein
VIARNYFHDKPGNGIQAKGGSADITIARNTLERVQQRFIQLGGSADPEFYRPSTAPYPASRITVIANIVRGVGVFDGRDVHRSVVFSLNGCNDCLVAHNTVLEIQFQATLVYIDKEDPNRPGNNDITLANNIFVMNDNADRGRSLAGNRFEFRVSPRGEPTASEVLFENEIYFDADAPTKKPIDVPPALRPEQFVGVGVFDPQLDASARPRVTSPALAFGATGHQTRVLGDYLGAPYGSPPAAGAFASPSSGDEPPAE